MFFNKVFYHGNKSFSVLKIILLISLVPLEYLEVLIFGVSSYILAENLLSPTVILISD